MALLTLAAFKKRLSLTDTDDDADLDGIVAAANAAVKAYLGFDPETTSYTDYPNATGERELVLPSAAPNCPVTVTTVHEDHATPPAFGGDTLLTAGEDYVQEQPGSAVLVRLGANWWCELRRGPDRLAATLRSDVKHVKVAYTLDTAAALAVARRAAMAEALAQWNVTNGGMGLGAVTSDAMDGASVTINTNAVPRRPGTAGNFTSPVAASWLAPFRKLPIG